MLPLLGLLGGGGGIGGLLGGLLGGGGGGGGIGGLLGGLLGGGGGGAGGGGGGGGLLGGGGGGILDSIGGLATSISSIARGSHGPSLANDILNTQKYAMGLRPGLTKYMAPKVSKLIKGGVSLSSIQSIMGMLPEPLIDEGQEATVRGLLRLPAKTVNAALMNPSSLYSAPTNARARARSFGKIGMAGMPQAVWGSLLGFNR